MTLRTSTALSRRAFLGTAAAGATMIALHPYSARAAGSQVHLRIMETTDLHVHVFPYNYYSDKPDDTVGLARTAAHIADIRAEATNSILVDNGDFLQGNPMGDYIAYERGMKEGDMHPVIQAMNTLGYEASTLGNHEFNYGLSFLEKALAGANFPVVSANIARKLGADPTKDETLLKPYVILDRVVTDGDGVEHQIKVGLIGFVPPQVMNWDRKHLEGNVQARDIVATAKAEAADAAEQAKKDLNLSIKRRLAAAEDQIASAEASAVKQVKDRAVAVAVAAARDVITSQIKAADANKMIDDSIDTVEAKLH